MMQVQQLFKKSALRWHPDRFESRFGPMLDEQERDIIMQRVKETFQLINAAREAHIKCTLYKKTTSSFN